MAEELELTVRCVREPARRITLGERFRPDEDGIGFCVDVQDTGLSVHVHSLAAWLYQPKLPGLLDGLVTDFAGWSGERTWEIDQLRVRATFHTGGHVRLEWTVWREPVEDGWALSVPTWLEAGEQLHGLAADVREFFDFRR